jgi:hypothetical protein
MSTYSGEDLTTAITAYRNGEYTSIRKCAYAFNIPHSTFSDQLTRATTRSRSHESQKILSTAEEETLLKSITRLSKSGYPITLSLTRDLAEEIRLSRFRLSSTPTSYPRVATNQPRFACLDCLIVLNQSNHASVHYISNQSI